MMRILKSHGAPPNLLRDIKHMSSGTRAGVLKPGGDGFHILVGVLQDNTLDPFLVIIALGYASHQWLRRSPWLHHHSKEVQVEPSSGSHRSGLGR